VGTCGLIRVLEDLAEAFLDCYTAEQWLERIGRPLN
jgi:hypothetical protein